jgi:hypothetical protein
VSSVLGIVEQGPMAITTEGYEVKAFGLLIADEGFGHDPGSLALIRKVEKDKGWRVGVESIPPLRQ